MSFDSTKVYKLVVRMTAGYGDDIDIVLHYRPYPLAVYPDMMAGLIADWQATAQVPFSQTFSNTCVIDKIQARTLTLPIEGREVLVGLAGTQTGDPLPQQIATQVLWNTQFLGRRFRGHNKFPYPGESQLTSGIWTTAHLSAVGNAAEKVRVLFDSLTGLVPTWNLVVWSVANQLGEDVTTYQVTRDPRSQLSRTIARGS